MTRKPKTETETVANTGAHEAETPGTDPETAKAKATATATATTDGIDTAGNGVSDASLPEAPADSGSEEVPEIPAALDDASGVDVVDPITLPLEPVTHVLVVTGPRQGRWRAGLFFGPEPVDLPLDSLSEDQITALQNDPALRAKIARAS